MNKKPEKKKRVPRKISPRYLENASLYYLQRYATSVENFKTVLKRKVTRSCLYHGGTPDEFYPLIDKIADRYQEVGLLNDSVFAEAKVNAMRRQGKSEKMIFSKLMAKGLHQNDIEKALSKIDNDTDGHAEFIAADKWARKKRLGPYRTKPITDIQKDRQKELAAMARAGFSYDIAKKALSTDESFETDDPAFD